jgi:hypothetical protein
LLGSFDLASPFCLAEKKTLLDSLFFSRHPIHVGYTFTRFGRSGAPKKKEQIVPRDGWSSLFLYGRQREDAGVVDENDERAKVLSRRRNL